MTRGAFIVDAPEGQRWDVALGLLASGESSVSIGSLTLRRDAAGPRATGRVTVDIRASASADSVTTATAGDITRGLDQLDLLLRDERFAALLAEHGSVCEYVDDYETGSVRLASVVSDRSISWDAGFEPSA